MIKASFFEQQDQLIGFEISGHSGYAESGKDIVCSAVTSAVMLTLNSISEFFQIPCDISVLENKISLSLDTVAGKQNKADFHLLVSSLKAHFQLIDEDYKNRLAIKTIKK